MYVQVVYKYIFLNSFLRYNDNSNDIVIIIITIIIINTKRIHVYNATTRNCTLCKCLIYFIKDDRILKPSAEEVLNTKMHIKREPLRHCQHNTHHGEKVIDTGSNAIKTTRNSIITENPIHRYQSLAIQDTDYAYYVRHLFLIMLLLLLRSDSRM